MIISLSIDRGQKMRFWTPVENNFFEYIRLRTILAWLLLTAKGVAFRYSLVPLITF